MTKDRKEKKPHGRPPAGAVLIDGRWQPTEKSVEIAVVRLLQEREKRRTRRQEVRELLRKEHPELFVVRGPDPKQTTLMAEARSDKQNGSLLQYQRKKRLKQQHRQQQFRRQPTLAPTAARQWHSKSSARISIPLRSAL